MKNKLFSNVLMLLFCLFGLFALETVSNADEYQITRYNAVANVRKDGKLELTQRITYDFDGSFNGVYYDQNLNKITDVSDISVSLEQDDKRINITEGSGQNNSYELQRTADNLKFKVYHKVEDEKVTIEYHYVLTGLITNYQDTAELNWKILGKGWDVPVENIDVTINLNKAPVPNLQGWAHGPLDGYIDVLKKQGQVKLTLDNLGTDDMLETHLLFPTTVTPDNPLVKDQKEKKKIQDAEAKLARQANEQRKANEQRTQFIKNVFLWVVCVLNLGFSLLVFKNWRSNKLKLPPLAHNYEIPQLPPAQVEALLNGTLKDNGKAFSAHLLELAGQGKLLITEAKGTNNYLITVKDPSVLQEKLLAFLVNEVGNGESFELKSLRKYGKSSRKAERLGKQFESWSKQNERAIKPYFDQKARELRIFVGFGLLVVLVLALCLAFFLGKTGMIVGAILAVVNGGLGGYYLLTHSAYTKEGQRLVYDIEGFRMMLDDIGRFDMREVGDIVLWEQIMPYAVVFGLAKKVLKELKVQFDLESPEYAPYYAYFALYNVNFSESFTQGVQTSLQSSVSGGSGGFSGGSSGGGGGGTGGAF